MMLRITLVSEDKKIYFYSSCFTASDGELLIKAGYRYLINIEKWDYELLLERNFEKFINDLINQLVKDN